MMRGLLVATIAGLALWAAGLGVYHLLSDPDEPIDTDHGTEWRSEVVETVTLGGPDYAVCDVAALVAAARRFATPEPVPSDDTWLGVQCTVACGSGVCDPECGCSGTASYHECKARIMRRVEEARAEIAAQRERDLAVLEECERVVVGGAGP